MFWNWKRKVKEMEYTLEEARREVRRLEYIISDLRRQVNRYHDKELKDWAERKTADIVRKSKQTPWKRDSPFWQIPPTNPNPSPIEPYFFYNQSPIDNFWSGNTEPNQSNTEYTPSNTEYTPSNTDSGSSYDSGDSGDSGSSD